MNPIIETYSRLADHYDDPANIASCWGQVTRLAAQSVVLQETHKVVVEVGCGTGRELADLAARQPAGVQWIGVEPAANMRALAAARTSHFPHVRILDGRFEDLPLDSRSVDYLYSILAFHWTTDLERSVAELARVLKPRGEMDLTFIGRYNGAEFIRKTTPIFFKYMTPAELLSAAAMRKQLRREEALALFGRLFEMQRLTVEESYHTYYDTLEGHLGWWLRVEGQFLQIPADRWRNCVEDVKSALATLATDRGIPYTVHLLHVRLSDAATAWRADATASVVHPEQLHQSTAASAGC